MKKKGLFIFIALIIVSLEVFSIDGFFFGYKTGILLKIDIASAFDSKRAKDMDNMPTGIGNYGVADPHGFPRTMESKVAPYNEMYIMWGYKFPKLFTLGFSFYLLNFVMPYITFDFKFSFREKDRVRPYTFLSISGGLLDGFPVGITAGGGIDIYFDEHFYLLVESKIGAEIFVSSYYDDGNNSHPIWHWDSTYAYGLFGIYLGLGYQFKNKYTDENGKWIGRK